jgi:hypothetical protein
VTETIKRTTQPYFVLDGNICALLAAKDHVNVFLYDGAIVPDPDGTITDGHDNKTARRIAIRQGETINARALTAMQAEHAAIQVRCHFRPPGTSGTLHAPSMAFRVRSSLSGMRCPYVDSTRRKSPIVAAVRHSGTNHHLNVGLPFDGTHPGLGACGLNARPHLPMSEHVLEGIVGRSAVDAGGIYAARAAWADFLTQTAITSSSTHAPARAHCSASFRSSQTTDSSTDVRGRSR